ncbi:hypothetical protein JHK82_050859 [Glycine max]|nr:hypothetical protein JHK86_050713 [Glycine max]KAG4936637.1 hypothetical protein JHK85_051556 [Glycine max]KAG5092081.1 hypothetical protein JHK82_050859 [Glycine max]KAG5095162.1 hypothetical protein JHK84_050750 [Glycine max]
MAKIMLKVAVPPNTILNTINAKDQLPEKNATRHHHLAHCVRSIPRQLHTLKAS